MLDQHSPDVNIYFMVGVRSAVNGGSGPSRVGRKGRWAHRREGERTRLEVLAATPVRQSDGLRSFSRSAVLRSSLLDTHPLPAAPA
jgi:hypothetical protein